LIERARFSGLCGRRFDGLDTLSSSLPGYGVSSRLLRSCLLRCGSFESQGFLCSSDGGFVSDNRSCLRLRGFN